jgi:pimeloyl-ACP methyl ester carboxylesterase
MFSRIARVLAGLSFVATAFGAAGAATIPTTHATFRAQGSTLAYTAYGTGPNVIVLAGGPGLNAAYVAPLARTIAGFGYRAILFDQRGTGASAAAGRNRALLTQAGTVADIDALRVALHERRLRFVTHSFGGGMALAYAAAHPGRVANLVLIGSVGTDLSTVDRFGAILMTHLSPSERKAYAAAGKSGDAAKALDIQLLAEFDDRKKALATIAAEPHPFIYPTVSNDVYVAFARTYRVGPALASVSAPLTLLTGADDAARAMEASLRAAFPDAHRVYISHSGHWPWIENPRDFDPALATALCR